MIDEIEFSLAYVADKMLSEKCSELHHTVELATGQKFKFHIKMVKQ